MATVLITGANRGIGLELCRQYARRGDEVIAVCRKRSEDLDSLGVRVESGIDVTSDSAVAELAERVNAVSIDILINNAGIFIDEPLAELKTENVARQLDVNVLGPLRVSLALLPNLVRGSKIAIITSQLGSIGENKSAGYFGYRVSKAGVNMVGKSLAVELQSKGVAVVLLHPGYVRTDMTDHQGAIDADESARGLIDRIDELTLETTGQFRHMNGREIGW